MIKILISACLLGEKVRYHGGDAALSDGILDRWRREGRLVPICPEVAGGLSVPRPAAEMSLASSVCSWAMPREILDFTVPIGTSSISAISL